RNVGFFRISLDFGKIPQVLETFLGDVYAHGVEDVSRRNENFAPDDFVLGAGVRLDVDSIYKRANTFLYAVVYIDQSGAGRRAFRNHNGENHWALPHAFLAHAFGWGVYVAGVLVKFAQCD